MNRLFLAIFMLVALAARAQDMEVPRIVSVTVNAQGQPVVRWQMANPSAVDGYIVKRLIVDGEGVISGTWNNVAVVEGGAQYQYVDNSTSYGTQARPADRREYYRISSYRKAGDRTYYSLMSDEASTIEASGYYDFCSNTYNISTPPQEGAVEYRLVDVGGGVVAISAEPVFAHVFDSHASIRRLSVECRTVGNAVSGSPWMAIEAVAEKAPDVLRINAVSAGDGAVDIMFDMSESKSVARAVLCRDTGGSLDTLEIGISSLESGVIHDIYSNSAILHRYSIAAINGCNQVIAQSPAVSNVVLQASEDEGLNSLEWNAPGFEDMFDWVEVMLMRDGDGPELLARMDISACSYQHRLDDADMASSGSFCYMVAYRQMPGNTGLMAASNISCTAHEPVMYVPNALDPYSDNPDNRTFRPYAEFASDYSLRIFDKRGAVVFRSNDISHGWDGRRGDSRLYPRDSYMYVITYKSAGGKKYEKHGFVNLVY